MRSIYQAVAWGSGSAGVLAGKAKELGSPDGGCCVSPHVIQSSPKSSAGWGERSLAQAMELTEQKVSQPQQIRSGFAGWMGNFFAMAIF
jgi:hypothetical protein